MSNPVTSCETNINYPLQLATPETASLNHQWIQKNHAQADQRIEFTVLSPHSTHTLLHQSSQPHPTPLLIPPLSEQRRGSFVEGFRNPKTSPPPWATTPGGTHDLRGVEPSREDEPSRPGWSRRRSKALGALGSDGGVDLIQAKVLFYSVDELIR